MAGRIPLMYAALMETSASRAEKRGRLAKIGEGPIIVLVAPQLGENIGAVARAMMNFGLSELRLVNPRDGWPNQKAVAMASGALAVIEQTRVAASLDEAIADRRHVVAMTARNREMLLPVMSPEEAARDLKTRSARGMRCAVLLGPERQGLSNDDMLCAHAIVSIPVNPGFPSLNLAQAALVFAYEWGKADQTESDGDFGRPIPAAQAEFDGLIDHLFGELDAARYFFPPEKRSVMERKIRVALARAGLTGGEVRTLRGVIKALTKKEREKSQ